MRQYVTFFCRLHIGGERGEKVKSPLLTGYCGSKAELGFDAQAECILHSTSDAQLSPAASLQHAKPSPIINIHNKTGLLHAPLIANRTVFLGRKKPLLATNRTTVRTK